MFWLARKVSSFVFRRVKNTRKETGKDVAEPLCFEDEDALVRNFFDLRMPPPERSFKSLPLWRKVLVLSQVTMGFLALVILLQMGTQVVLGSYPLVQRLARSHLRKEFVQVREETRLVTAPPLIPLGGEVVKVDPFSDLDSESFNTEIQPSRVVAKRASYPNPNAPFAVPAVEPSASGLVEEQRWAWVEEYLLEMEKNAIVATNLTASKKEEYHAEGEKLEALQLAEPVIRFQVGQAAEPSLQFNPYQWAEADYSAEKSNAGSSSVHLEDVYLPGERLRMHELGTAATSTFGPPPSLFFNPAMAFIAGKSETWWVLRVEEAQHFYPFVQAPQKASWVYFGESRNAELGLQGWQGKDKQGRFWFRSLVLWKGAAPFKEGQNGSLKSVFSLFQ